MLAPRLLSAQNIGDVSNSGNQYSLRADEIPSYFVLQKEFFLTVKSIFVKSCPKFPLLSLPHPWMVIENLFIKSELSKVSVGRHTGPIVSSKERNFSNTAIETSKYTFGGL